jgi:hypothetical protein
MNLKEEDVRFSLPSELEKLAARTTNTGIS